MKINKIDLVEEISIFEYVNENVTLDHHYKRYRNDYWEEHDRVENEYNQIINLIKLRMLEELYQNHKNSSIK